MSCCRTEIEIVWDEGMHPVDSDELFRYGVGHLEMVLRRARDAAVHLLTPNDTSEKRIDSPLAGQPPPVGSHGSLQGRMTEDGGGPLDGVNLGHERHIDEPGAREQIIVGPGWVLGTEVVADCVVLQGKEHSHHG